MNSTAKTVASDSESLARDLRALVEDAQALLQHAVRDAGTGYDAARSRLEEGLADARARLTAYEKAAVDGIRKAGRDADAYVHENPWPAIGVGAGVGLLLGLAIGRR